MSKIFRYPTPSVGMKGVYTLNSPFSSDPGEILECIAVRSLTSYIANNDDALTDVYKKAGLTEDDYASDLDADMEIISLVNTKGYRLLVPAKYIASYPVVDGVFYRGISIGTALPLMPVEQNLQFILDDIATLIRTKLGVDSQVKLIETTEPRAVTQDQHKSIQAARKVIISGDPTLYTTVAKQQQLIANQAARIQELEAYIIAHP